ncbi:MAG: hypothetical protein ACRC9M_03805, partial [Aeromonas sp.]
MHTSLVGVSILWGLASFGTQGDFIQSREPMAPSWQAKTRVEVEGYLIESLGEDRWLFDNGNESLQVSLPAGQWVPCGERLRISGELQQEPTGWLLQVADICQ